MALPKWLMLVQMLGPAILNSFGVPLELTGAIVDGVNEAEQIPDASGPDKKKHVLAIVGDAIVAVNSAKGRQLLDPLRVQKLTGDAIDLVVEAVDLVHDRTVDPNQLNVPSEATESAPQSIPPTLRTPATAAPAAAQATAQGSDPTPPPPEAEEPPPAAPAHPESTKRKGKPRKG